jgi:hypothetical protein
MTAHLFGGLGMMPFGIVTDPGLPNFMQRARMSIPGLVLHGPYRDYNTGEIAKQADALPVGDIVFVVMTSLSANDAFIITGYAKRKIHCLMFQASKWGPAASAPSNVGFAHLIYSYMPIPVPLIGAYIPGPGTMTVVSKSGYDASYKVADRVYVQSNINLPHPGDYDAPSQELFIGDMKRLIGA